MPGQQGGDDVVFVISGDGDEGVHVHDPFGGQQVVVGTVPLNDEGVGKGVGDAPGALDIALDDLDVHLARQLAGDELADQTPAEHHDVGYFGLLLPCQLDKLITVGRVGHDVDLVTRYQHILAAGDHGLLLARDGGDAHRRTVGALAELLQRYAQQR